MNLVCVVDVQVADDVRVGVVIDVLRQNVVLSLSESGVLICLVAYFTCSLHTDATSLA